MEFDGTLGGGGSRRSSSSRCLVSRKRFRGSRAARTASQVRHYGHSGTGLTSAASMAQIRRNQQESARSMGWGKRLPSDTGNHRARRNTHAAVPEIARECGFSPNFVVFQIPRVQIDFNSVSKERPFRAIFDSILLCITSCTNCHCWPDSQVARVEN